MMHHTRSPDPERDVFGRAAIPLPTAAEAAAADRTARERHGVPERVLMESAGRAAALVLQRLYPAGAIVGVAGSGNNGGDLLVMLRVLQAWGRDVAIITAGSRPPDTDLAHGDVLRVVSDDAEAAVVLAGADVIVDGMLGTGTSGAARGRVRDWIRRINGAGRPVLALDLPSGVDATSGAVQGDAVRADVTVTFGWPKLGLLLHPARPHCGRLVAVEIGFPGDGVETSACAITPGLIRDRLPTRSTDAHKGSAGRLLVLAGSSGMAGAAALAVQAALRAGAGLVRVASDAANRTVLQTLVPEATFLDRAAVREEDVAPMHALVAGPGLGTDAAAHAALDRALALTGDRPVLLDADALNIMAAGDGADRLRGVADGRPVLLTPHVLELARLTGASVGELLADVPAAARTAARRFGAHVLLKGQPSVIAAPDGTLLVNTAGSSDLATAGMGDQLAGTIGAFLAGGCSVQDAAAMGMFLSSRAADLCGLGVSLVPGDVSARLAYALADPGPRQSTLDLPFVTFDQPPRW
jgi:ADP-dependent NAD(P)H-hydrate dehydratase / NAD(P)H-hydrate epimerase